MDSSDFSRSLNFLDETEPCWSPATWYRERVLAAGARVGAPDLDTLFARLLGERVTARAPALPEEDPREEDFWRQRSASM